MFENKSHTVRNLHFDFNKKAFKVNIRPLIL